MYLSGLQSFLSNSYLPLFILLICATEVLCVNYDTIKLQVKQPILLLSGLQDEMVPPSHMEMLYAKAAARNQQCLFVEFPTGMHMDTWLAGGDRYWRTIQEFLEKTVPEKKDSGSSRMGKFCTLLQSPNTYVLHYILYR